MRVLLELRPAFDGHAGIPQETRLLFRALRRMEGIDAQGLIQSSGHVLAKGLAVGAGEAEPIDRRLHALSRVVISSQEIIYNRYLATIAMAVRTMLGGSEHLGRFEAAHFRDFLWRALFANTLHASDFDSVTSAGFRVSRIPWSAMHRCALFTRNFGHALYPRLDTAGFDAMIVETPYPARVSPGTQLVVRYHDAFPILMPHTINQMEFHQASHYYALRENVRSGARFACVSEATRKDLLGIFPQLGERSTVIHNMVSHHYFPEDRDSTLVPEILRSRANLEFEKETARSSDEARGRASKYILMVSTIEPRKNHSTLLAAWEELRAGLHPDLKLVLVGELGWDHESIKRKLGPWIARGDLFALEDVPPAELRLLYRHAQATICPSYGEGFDFSGVEAMRCASPVIASDIPVHREIFADAAQYFSPYSSADLANAIAVVLDRQSPGRRDELVGLGTQVSTRYLFDAILPQWQQFLQKLPRA
ncbi:MAG TPA: glycosyltransferase family 1 protein [Usitatibacter sp.]|nr:glycosyltransferase family 1 protein [Usitatibacter sp.]